MRVLVHLAQRSGDVVARQALMAAVWQEAVVTEQVLSRAVSVLRKVFRDAPKRPTYIQTIPKHGYRLIAPVTPATPVTRGDTKMNGGARSDRWATPTDRRRPVNWLVAGLAIAFFGLAALLHFG